MSIKLAYSREILISYFLGSIYDLSGDIRKGSGTFDKWTSVKLSPKNEKLFWIFEGFVHAFLPLEYKKRIQYKVTFYWIKNYVRLINWNDKFIKNVWDFNSFGISRPILCKKDKEAPYSLEILENEVLG